MKHIFSIYLKELSSLILDQTENSEINFFNKLLSQRLTKILRLKEDENFILFDSQINCELKLLKNSEFSKNRVLTKIIKIKKNTKTTPKILFCPALTKKGTFELIVSFASSLGINIIQPVISAKSQKYLFNQKEIERLEKISLSACELSKNYLIPQICTPTNIQNISSYKDYKKITFDFDGENISSLIKEIKDVNFENKYKGLLVLTGPESGLEEEELKFLIQEDFNIYKLTPTILKAEQAALVGLGLLRSL